MRISADMTFNLCTNITFRKEIKSSKQPKIPDRGELKVHYQQIPKKLDLVTIGGTQFFAFQFLRGTKLTNLCNLGENYLCAITEMVEHPLVA
jgi:hypothetical protein